MIATAFELAGGIGLFLLGMVLLTDGLKTFAGGALRDALLRFTGTPVKAFVSGALVTLMVQSSSATTVALIGFVSAGLITFAQAVGVVLGASLGTTGTGWIVSVLGLKVSLGFYALPLVAAGALARLLGRGRARPLGLALAGFGLIFIGIEFLQQGMRGLSDVFPLANLPVGGIAGSLAVMAIGAAMTVVMQSSSAAVATTLTALHTAAISFEQAATLVIGAAIGTTVTGALAAVGGTVPARRTAAAHILFNLGTGLIAVALLPALLWIIGFAQRHFGLDAGATSLAAFHTIFIGLGVALVLPFADRFAHLIERLLPDRGPALTRHLDDSLLSVPAVALEATRRALSEAAAGLFAALRGIQTGAAADASRAAELREALERIQVFFARIPAEGEEAPVSRLRLAQVHAIDHLVRLQSRLQPRAELLALTHHERLRPAAGLMQSILALGEAGLQGHGSPGWLAEVETRARELAGLRAAGREDVLRETASGDWSPHRALELLDAVRWLERVGYHAWRVCNYLGGEGKEEPEALETAAALEE